MSCRESTAFCIPASKFSPVLGKGWNLNPGELAEKQLLMPSDLRLPLDSFTFFDDVTCFAVLTTALVL